MNKRKHVQPRPAPVALPQEVVRDERATFVRALPVDGSVTLTRLELFPAEGAHAAH